jgi:hypothetical protein
VVEIPYFRLEKGWRHVFEGHTTMSSPSPAQTTQISKVELPAWVDQASQENYQLAKDVSGRPFQQYSGSRVADPSAMTTQGYGMLGRNVGSNDQYFTGAGDIYKDTSGKLDISPYLNPYTKEVEERAIDSASTALTKQLAGNASAAQKAGAFGGSRFGVQQGVMQAEGAKGIGDLVAQLRKQGFDTATSTALADRTGRQASAAGLLSTGTGRQASQMGDVTAMLTAGQQDEAQRQKVIDAAMQKFSEATNYPVEQLNMRLAALGMSPYGKTETMNKTATSESKGPDWSLLGAAGIKALPSLLPLLSLSDRGDKTDIKKLTDGEIPLYAYRYKDDPKSYPKIVGPMAQDIEKKYPFAVKKVGRHKVVDYSNLMEVLS